jgi:rare lipoprotein A
MLHKKLTNMRKLSILIVILLISFSSFAGTEGVASYYHDNFNGRKTASGMIYHKDRLTCAHRTYPFGTKLEITNLSNGDTVVVTVTDRGPFNKGCIVDLSKAAARKLHMIEKGLQKVKIKVVKS